MNLLCNSHPVETAEYAIVQRIDKEPAFNWWVPHVIKKREAIIQAVKSRKTGVHWKSHKFGIESSTYASVVTCETVRIALMIAALNDLEVKAGDVLNAYLTATNSEKIWTVLGPEWGPDQGKRAILVRTLYGLKSVGASF